MEHDSESKTIDLTNDKDHWADDEASSGDVSMEHDATVDGDTVIVGEQLFYDLCEAWLDRKGPALFRYFLAQKDKKEVFTQKTEVKSNTPILRRTQGKIFS